MITFNNYYVVESQKIHVYPSAYRGYTQNAGGTFTNIDEEAKLNTEYNIVNTQTAVYKKNYISSYKEASSSESDYKIAVEFSIDGYFFRLKLTQSDIDTLKGLLGNDKKISAYIITKEVNILNSDTAKTPILYPWNETSSESLATLDNYNSKYQVAEFRGMLFGTVDPTVDTSYTLYKLELFTLVNDKFDVVESSYISSDAKYLSEDTISEGDTFGTIKYNYIDKTDTSYSVKSKSVMVKGFDEVGESGNEYTYLNQKGNFVEFIKYDAGNGIIFDKTNKQIKANTEFTTSEADKNYAVKTSKDGSLFVNVPWKDTDTTYTADNKNLLLDNTTFKITDTPSFTSVTADSYNATSDARLKENIREYKCDKSILDLPIFKYDFIDGPKNQIGCLAQDLLWIAPELVNVEDNGYLSISETKLIYLLLQEVKDLKKKVEDLERR